MQEKMAVTEPPKSPEFSTANKPLALQSRLVQGGEALESSNTTLPDLKPEDLAETLSKNQEKTLGKIAVAITKKQHEVWKDDTRKHDEQVEAWSTRMAEVLGNEKYASHRETLQKIHFGGLDYSAFTQETAKQLYRKYVEGGDVSGNQTQVLVFDNGQYLPANLMPFVNDVFVAHQNAEDKTIDFASLEQNLDSIITIAKIYGEPNAKIIENFIKGSIAALKSKESREEFAKLANEKAEVVQDDGQKKEMSRQNWLNPEEKKLLELLEDADTVQTTVIVKPTPSASTSPSKPLMSKPPPSTVPLSPKPAVPAPAPLPVTSIEPVTPKKGEYTEEEMSRFVAGQKKLIELVKQPEGKRQQDLVLEKLPEIFDLIPQEFRIPVLYYEDSLLVLAGLKPVFHEESWLILESYDREKVKKANEALSQLGVRIEINEGKAATTNPKTGQKEHAFVIYNPQALEAYTKANPDISPSYSSSQTFYEWNEQTLGMNPTLGKGLKNGYPVSSILDTINGVTPLDRIAFYMEDYYGRKDSLDVKIREQAKKDFFTRYEEMLKTNPKLKPISPEMQEATHAWRVFLELETPSQSTTAASTTLSEKAPTQDEVMQMVKSIIQSTAAEKRKGMTQPPADDLEAILAYCGIEPMVIQRQSIDILGKSNSRLWHEQQWRGGKALESMSQQAIEKDVLDDTIRYYGAVFVQKYLVNNGTPQIQDWIDALFRQAKAKYTEDWQSNHAILEAIRTNPSTKPYVDELVRQFSEAYQKISAPPKKETEQAKKLSSPEDFLPYTNQASYLHGKFDADWSIGGKAIGIDPVHNSDEVYRSIAGTKDLSLLENLDPDYARAIMKLYQLFDNSNKREVTKNNYLFFGQPNIEIGTKLGSSNMTFVPITYLAWSHAATTPDSRGSTNHLPLKFQFYLPENIAKEFRKAIISNPDVIEKIFQLSYPGLTGPNGLQRVQTNSLSLIDITDDLVQIASQERSVSRLPKTELSFSTPVGERPFD